MINEEAQLIERIGRNDVSVIDILYDRYKSDFISFFKKYNLPEEELRDIYQDTMVALFQNILHNKVNGFSASIKTYVFSIGKYKIIDHIRKQKQKVNDTLIKGDDIIELLPLENKELTIEQKKLYKAFKLLGDKCQHLLKLFYYRGLSIEDIVRMENYKDSNTVKSMKSRCMKQLKSTIKNK